MRDLDALPKQTPILGLDLGTKTIGLALSNSSQRLATPLPLIKRKKFRQDAEALQAIIQERRVGGLVLGLPLNMDSSEGPRAQATRAFARNLNHQAGITLPVVFWDERLSTVAVERDLIETLDVSRAKRAEQVDSAAAAFILQGVLDAIQARKASAAEGDEWGAD